MVSKQRKRLEQLLIKLIDWTVVKILVCAVAALRLLQRRFVAMHLMRIGKGGGGSYHLTEKQLLWHLFYTVISNRGEDIFKQHNHRDKTEVYKTCYQWNVDAKQTNSKRSQQADIMSRAAIITVFQSDWLRGWENRPGFTRKSIKAQVLCHEHLLDVWTYL